MMRLVGRLRRHVRRGDSGDDAIQRVGEQDAAADVQRLAQDPGQQPKPELAARYERDERKRALRQRMRRRQLERETRSWERFSGIVARLLAGAEL